MGTFQILNGGLNVNNKLLVNEYGQIITQLTVGSGGGFAYGHGWKINGNYLGQFGLYGSDTSANYFYFGTDYLDPWVKIEPNGKLHAKNYIKIGANLEPYDTNRAELSVVSSADSPGEIWLGTKGSRVWSISARHSETEGRISFFSIDTGHIFYINKDSSAYLSGCTFSNGTMTGTASNANKLGNVAANKFFARGSNVADSSCNDVTTSKSYWSTNTATEAPTTWGGLLDFDTGNHHQIFLSYEGNDSHVGLYTRAKVNGVWQPWTRFLNESSNSNFSGHLYLTKANASSSTSNTSQIVFGTSSNNYLALSSNTHALILNPSTTSTTNQIILSLDSVSQFPKGVNYAQSAGSANSVAWSNITGKPNRAGSSSDGGAANSSDILNINNSANLSGCLQYIQVSAQTSGNDLPTNTWWHVIKMNHGNGDTYYKRLLAFDFWNDNIMTSGAAQDGTVRTWKQVWVEGNSITGAVWNDYAEYRESDCEEFGRVLIEKGNDSLTKSTERLQHFAGISSDTWGFCQGKTEKAKTPIAVAGRVLAYPYQDRNNYKPGDCVCAAPGGTVDIMTREEVRDWPDRIVGTVSCVPKYEEWGSGDRDPVKVNGRIWIKVR